MMKKILVVEDDDILADNICTYFKRQHWEAAACGSAEQALPLMASMAPGVVLADQTLPGLNGTELTQRLRQTDPRVKVIMITGDESARTAVEAMKAGACDYVTKPFALPDLKCIVDNALAAESRERRPSARPGESPQGSWMTAMIGESPLMLDLKAKIRKLLAAEQHMIDGSLPAVLVHGETGSGKELVARSLHNDRIGSSGPLVEINCASIPSQLLEGELFGHEKGAFTDAKEQKVGLVEAADGGTLFLDEIGEIDFSIQAKLLKLLEEKTFRRLGAVKEMKVSLRVVSATNRDLEQMVREGRFRSDLYFRLRVIYLKVPPLRARGSDILLLARHYLALHGRRYGKGNLAFSPDAEQALMRHDWPGNVRELRNTLERTALFASEATISAEDLRIGLGLLPDARGDRSADVAAEVISVAKAGARLGDTDRDLLVATLEKTDWNVSKAAKLLDISRAVLRYRMESLNLVRPR